MDVSKIVMGIALLMVLVGGILSLVLDSFIGPGLVGVGVLDLVAGLILRKRLNAPPPPD